MRTPKRIIALVMAIAMMSTCGVSTAFAAARADDTDTTPPADQAYSITVAKNDNAAVSVKVGGKEVTKAKEGDLVTVVAKGKTGYWVSKVNITAAGSPNSIHTPVDGAENTYTFKMPATNVTVTVTTEADEPMPDGKKYAITVKGAENAVVSTKVNGQEVKSAKAGEEITLLVTPNLGYRLFTLDVTDNLTWSKDGHGGPFTFKMPAKPIVVTVVTQLDPIDPDKIDPATDVNVTVPDGTTAGGKEIKEVTKGIATGKEVTQITNSLASKLATAGLIGDPAITGFVPVDIKVLDKDGNALTGTLSKPVTVAIDITVPGFEPTKTNMRILHNHNGTIEIIKLTGIVHKSGDTYTITFPMSKFSTVLPVVVKSTGGGTSTGSGSGSYSGGSSGGGGTVVDREFDGNKMYLTGGENVSAKVVEEIAGTDKVYTVVYRGQTYTFNGKNVAKPGKGVIYYTAEEFMKLVQGKLVSASGTVGGEGNPDTGANDFVGLAMTLGMVSLAGIAACGVAKKK